MDFQVFKGVRWMPWHRQAMKDVVSCDKLRGAAHKRRSGDFRMGQPGGSNVPSLKREPTRGTETSKYPEEEKTTVIPQVAASERGRAQTDSMSSVGALYYRGRGTFRSFPIKAMELQRQ